MTARVPRTRPAKAPVLATKVGRAKRTGPKVRTKTDITLPPGIIDKMKLAAFKAEVPMFEWQRLALKSFAKYRMANPVEPPPTKCEACGRAFKLRRGQGDFRRVRVTVNFDAVCSDTMEWLATTYYHGTYSQAFEAAVRHFLGGDDGSSGKR